MKLIGLLFACIMAVSQVSAQALPILPRPCGSPYTALPTALPTPYLPSSSVANNLADTLSLLTVSSLLAEKLPYADGYYPAPLAAPLATTYLPEALPAPYLPGPYIPETYLPGPYLPGAYLPGSYLPGCSYIY